MNTPRFDTRAVPATALMFNGNPRAGHRAKTTIKSGRAAFGNKEMRAIFKGAK